MGRGESYSRSDTLLSFCVIDASLTVYEFYLCVGNGWDCRSFDVRGALDLPHTAGEQVRQQGHVLQFLRPEKVLYVAQAVAVPRNSGEGTYDPLRAQQRCYSVCCVSWSERDDACTCGAALARVTFSNLYERCTHIVQ